MNPTNSMVNFVFPLVLLMSWTRSCVKIQWKRTDCCIYWDQRVPHQIGSLFYQSLPTICQEIKQNWLRNICRGAILVVRNNISLMFGYWLNNINQEIRDFCLFIFYISKKITKKKETIKLGTAKVNETSKEWNMAACATLKIGAIAMKHQWEFRYTKKEKNWFNSTEAINSRWFFFMAVFKVKFSIRFTSKFHWIC